MDLFSYIDSDAKQPGIGATEAADILNRAIAGSARKTALKGLAGPARDRLVAAVAVVVSQKRAAYQRAHSGPLQPAGGWVVDQPELAAAVAVLNEHFIDELPIALEQQASPVA